MTNTNGNLAMAGQETLTLDPAWVKAQEARAYCHDDAMKSFSDINEMLAFLEEREKNSKWVEDVEIGKLNLQLLENALLNSAGNLRDEIVRDTEKNTNLVIQGSIPQTALRSCAISTMLERAQISGKALTRMEKSVFRDVVNEAFNVASPKARGKVRIADGKVSAILSNIYVPISMPSIFNMAAEHIQSRFPKNMFAGGSWNHSFTSAEWALTGENDLVSAYVSALERHNIEYDEIQPAIRIFSSDIGESSVNVIPKLVIGKDRVLLPLANSVGVEHRGDTANIESVRENIKGIYALYSKGLKQLTDLLSVQISHPVNCMTEILKRNRVQQKYAAATVAAFSRGFAEGDTCTAHDIYYGMGELMMQMQLNNADSKTVLRTEELIAKILSMDFATYDIPAKGDN